MSIFTLENAEKLTNCELPKLRQPRAEGGGRSGGVAASVETVKLLTNMCKVFYGGEVGAGGCTLMAKSLRFCIDIAISTIYYMQMAFVFFMETAHALFK